MPPLYYLLTLALILLHFAGLGALLSRCIPSFHIARAVGVLGVVLVCFFLEHFEGLGRLTGWWPCTAAASALLLWHDRARLKKAGFIKAEAVFWALVGYGLLWKWCFPSIYPTSERLTDLYFITNYLAGGTLPPPDHWFAPHRFDFYYAFQHYAAALMGRMFGLSPGLSYNLAMPLLMGTTAALVWDFSGRFIMARGWRLLLLATFMLGGTGATPFVHLVNDGASTGSPSADANSAMFGSARFVGLYDQEHTRNAFWRRVFLPPVPAGFERRELPMEDFGYQYFIGDYHPPLSGFFLLALALALIGLVERGHGGRRLHMTLLGASVPITIAANTWVFPLQALLVAGWVLWRSRKGQPGESTLRTDGAALIAGGIASLALIYPFLAGFAAKSQPTPIRLVGAIDHTPLAQFLALHWPMLLLVVLGIIAGVPSRRARDPAHGLAFYFALAFAVLLFFTEMLYVDDPSGGRYERTNSVMKWWGWLWSGAVIALGSLLLGSPARWMRWLAGLAFGITCLYAADVAYYFRATGMADRGQLHGGGVYTQDATVRAMFRYLADAPHGIVLENVYGDAYSDSTVYATFAGQPALLGWPMHLVTWHGEVPEAWLTRDAIVALYAGTLPGAQAWLQARDVRYIVWTGRDAQNAQAWSQLQGEIGAHYAWHGFSPAGQPPVGLWVRR